MPITKLKLEDSVCANLGNSRDSPCLQELPESCSEYGWGGGRGSGEVGQVAAEAGVYNQLPLVFGFRELE